MLWKRQDQASMIDAIRLSELNLLKVAHQTEICLLQPQLLVLSSVARISKLHLLAEVHSQNPNNHQCLCHLQEILQLESLAQYIAHQGRMNCNRASSDLV